MLSLTTTYAGLCTNQSSSYNQIGSGLFSFACHLCYDFAGYADCRKRSLRTITAHIDVSAQSHSQSTSNRIYHQEYLSLHPSSIWLGHARQRDRLQLPLRAPALALPKASQQVIALLLVASAKAVLRQARKPSVAGKETRKNNLPLRRPCLKRTRKKTRTLR